MIGPALRGTRGVAALVLAAGVLAMPSAGRADVLVTYTQGGNGPAGDGPVEAQATFATFTNLTVNGQTCNGIEVTIQNLLAPTGGEGQAISGLSFHLGSQLQGATTFLQDQGPEVTTSSNGNTSPVTATGTATTPASNPFLHWGAQTSSTDVTLQTAGNAAQPGKPNHLIIGEADSYNASYQQHDPSFLQTATFWICDAAVQSDLNLQPLSDISDVTFYFGTGPSAGTEGTTTYTSVTPVPEPSSFALAGLGLLSLGGLVVRRSRLEKKGKGER